VAGGPRVEPARQSVGSRQVDDESIGFGEQKRIVYAKWLDGRELTP